MPCTKIFLSWKTLVPKAFVHENGVLKGMNFEKVKAVYDEKGKRSLVPAGEAEIFLEADDVLVAIGQENSFPWIERDLGLNLTSGSYRF
jgi:formate dehydrogenase beta subunit